MECQYVHSMAAARQQSAEPCDHLISRAPTECDRQTLLGWNMVIGYEVKEFEGIGAYWLGPRMLDFQRTH